MPIVPVIVLLSMEFRMKLKYRTRRIMNRTNQDMPRIIYNLKEVISISRGNYKNRCKRSIEKIKSREPRANRSHLITYTL